MMMRRSHLRLWLYIVGLAALAVPINLLAVASFLPGPASASLPAWIFVPLFAVAEIAVVHVHVRRHAQTFSLSEVPLVLGLLCVSPVALLAARLAGAAIALFGHRRQPPVKAMFNLSLFAVDTGLAILVFNLVLGAGPRFSVAGAGAAILAMSLCLLVGSVAISIVIAIAEARAPQRIFSGVAFTEWASTVGSAMAGFLAALVVSTGTVGRLLLLPVAIVLFAAYRAHARLRSSHMSLEQVHAFTQAVGNAEGDALFDVILEQASELMRAEYAELTLTGLDDESLAAIVRGGRLALLSGSDAEDIAAAHRALLRDTDIALVPRNDRAGLAGAVPSGTKDAIVARLGERGSRLGTIAVGNRLTDIDPFATSDLDLFATLARHATIVLRNQLLIEQLRGEAARRQHQALHDPLTGLPNRGYVESVLQRSLELRNKDELVGVMLLDLDRFKEVNDTLGHHRGDDLLRTVAERIRISAHAGSIVARLGGDEFAVVIPRALSREDIIANAQTLLASLSEPFEVCDIAIDVDASIGVAVSPDDGATPEALLQRADVAMYSAKRGARDVEFYNPEVDHYSRERLSLAAKLRRTIERGELLVDYQPKADVVTDRIVGVEALARWHHPDHGFVPPDLFIPVAERSGLIRALLANVLRVSLEQNRVWRDQGFDLSVAVNLSPRNLLDEQLLTLVRDCLREHNLPPSALTLEITESTILVDPARTVGVLHKLSGMGVSIAIDDFGTGYSSLAYLKRLPVDELKIDRSFVATMADDENDTFIVRSIIDLARNLGLLVTAEGVEDERTWQSLARFGCHQVQGYFLARPLPAAQLLRWLRDREGERKSLAALASGNVVPLDRLS